MSRTTLTVIVFPGGHNWPLFVAEDKGLFAREEIEVAVTPTPGSVYQLTNLIAGTFDIGMTAIDNVIAYDEGQGEVRVEGTPDLFAFMGGNHGFLSLVVQPEITTYADLKGADISVDALTTGFAFVLRKMLALNGLGDGDYRLVPVGGTLERWQALQQKAHAGTLLGTPFDLMGEAKGLRVLGKAVDQLRSYEALVGATRRSWAPAHRTELAGFIRGYVGALGWLFDRANKAEAIEILRRRVPQIGPELAAKTYDVFCAPGTGLHPKAALDLEGVQTALRLRSEYVQSRAPLTDPGKYYDLSYYTDALAAR